MANETTYALVSQYIPVIWEAALLYARQNFVMPGLVQMYTGRGMAPRQVTEYAEGSVQENLGELEDLTPSLFERHLLSQLVPAETGKQYIITDRRIESDTESVLADAASAIGYEIGKSLEVNLLTDIASVEGGSVGTANNALTWADIFNGRARLAAAGVPGPYSVVLHEYQWLDLATDVNIAGVGTTVLTTQPGFESRYYIGSLNDMAFYVSGLVPVDGNDDATGGIFNRQALALDMRRGLRIEPERDASLRSTELNATMIYAHGIWRPAYGVKIISDATAPGSAVTVNSSLLVVLEADDISASAGQDITFTLTIINTGTHVASDISMVFTVDADFTYLSTPTISQGVYNSTSKTWSAGSLAPGESAVLRVVYDVAGSGDMVATIDTLDVTPNLAADATDTVTITVS